MTEKKVAQTIYGKVQSEGHGAKVRRTIGSCALKNLDPFLLLDQLVECELPNGFPDHAHRGFETVSYVISGSMRHEDFCGHEGVLSAGDVQWMTAGRGIVHSEMPHTHATGENNAGFQLWINLEAKHKMCEPQYQEVKNVDIPAASASGVRVKVIAGSALGVSSSVLTRTPAFYLDFALDRGASVTQPLPVGWNAFVYVISGRIKIDDVTVNMRSRGGRRSGECLQSGGGGGRSAVLAFGREADRRTRRPVRTFRHEYDGGN